MDKKDFQESISYHAAQLQQRQKTLAEQRVALARDAAPMIAMDPGLRVHLEKATAGAIAYWEGLVELSQYCVTRLEK